MSPQRTCPDCGSPLPADAPRGLCSQCLIGAALSANGSAATGLYQPAGSGVEERGLPSYWEERGIGRPLNCPRPERGVWIQWVAPFCLTPAHPDQVDAEDEIPGARPQGSHYGPLISSSTLQRFRPCFPERLPVTIVLPLTRIMLVIW